MTIDKQRLLELASSVEALSGPDREVDRKIKALVGHEWDYSADWDRWDALRGEKVSEPVAKPYTASLDAAMTLVSEEWHCGLGRDGNLHSPTACWAWVRFRVSEGNWQETPMNFRAKTPAIALTAAALRALSHTASIEEKG